MIHCPNEEREDHPPPERNEFVVMALIRVGPEFDFRSVQDHLLEDVLCRTCGAEATMSEK